MKTTLYARDNLDAVVDRSTMKTPCEGGLTLYSRCHKTKLVVLRYYGTGIVNVHCGICGRQTARLMLAGGPPGEN